MNIPTQGNEELLHWLKVQMAAIPEDHPFARAMVTTIKMMRDESHDYLVASPGVVSDADRTYNAGRVSFAEDLLSRLARWRVVGSVAAASQSQTVPDSPQGDTSRRQG